MTHIKLNSSRGSSFDSEEHSDKVDKITSGSKNHGLLKEHEGGETVHHIEKDGKNYLHYQSNGGGGNYQSVHEI